MTPIPDDVIEAGARAMADLGVASDQDYARACLTAALQHAEAKHGAVLAKVPEERLSAEVANNSFCAFTIAAIAAFRAGRMGDKG